MIFQWSVFFAPLVLIFCFILAFFFVYFACFSVLAVFKRIVFGEWDWMNTWEESSIVLCNLGGFFLFDWLMTWLLSEYNISSQRVTDLTFVLWTAFCSIILTALEAKRIKKDGWKVFVTEHDGSIQALLLIWLGGLVFFSLSWVVSLLILPNGVQELFLAPWHRDLAYEVEVFYATDREPITDKMSLARRSASSMFSVGMICLMTAICLLLIVKSVEWLVKLKSMKESIFNKIKVISGILGCVGGLLCLVCWIWSFALFMWPGPQVETLTKSYGPERGSKVSPMHYGTCRVTIPKDHLVGSLESPSIIKLQYAENPEKHVVLQQIQELSPGAFMNLVHSNVDAEFKAKGLREAFVFVHGFYVSFEDAARRTAQLAYDLKFEGAPIFFSWPSQGRFLDYTVDETNVEWAVPHLENFLNDLRAQSGATRIYLIAHSMGNRCLTNALRRLKNPAANSNFFREVILAAPDIDAETFQSDILPAIIPHTSRVTLYASSRDKALEASKLVHKYKRVGDTDGGVLIMPPMETVDVSSIDTSFDGHSYYGDNSSVISDLYYLIHDGKRAAERFGMKEKESEGQRYWVFLPRQ